MSDKDMENYVSACVYDAFTLARLEFTPHSDRYFPTITLDSIVNKMALLLGGLNVMFILALMFCIVRYFYL